MHARGLARDLGGAAQRTTHCGGEFFASLQFGFSFDGDLSNNVGLLAEFSYTSRDRLKDDSGSTPNQPFPVEGKGSEETYRFLHNHRYRRARKL